MTDAVDPRRNEVAEKLDRVRGHLESTGRQGLLLTTLPNVTWLLGGSEHWVSRSMSRSFAWVYVTADDFFVLALENEQARLRDELRVEALGAELRTAPWWSSLEELVAGIADGRVITDADGPGEVVPQEIQRLRLALVEDERERLRRVGADACVAVEGTLQALRVDELASTTEREIAARVVGAFERLGIVAGGIMVGGHDRRQRFRHPVVTDAAVGASAMVVVIAVRGGLNVALTRTVSVGSDEHLRQRHATACQVEAAMIAASRPGVRWNEALEAGLVAYRDAGLADEWAAHTQGGPIGYAPREYIAYPPEATVELVEPLVREHQAFAWNPTVQGAKSEDTFLVTSGAPEPVSTSDRWPSTVYDAAGVAVPRPDVLELS